MNKNIKLDLLKDKSKKTEILNFINMTRFG